MQAFRMPAVQTMNSRKSSITNAFVNSVIPSIAPSPEDIEEALAILGMDYASVRCAYCGDKSSEWDHLRPLVIDLRPTGYISEIANLVPSCGKCNQSKRNESWRTWMLREVRHSPTGRGILDVAERVARLDAYERWRPVTKVDLESIIGPAEWQKYWQLYDAIIADMRRCQEVADAIKAKAIDSLKP
jgi:hypothetical protein